MAVGHEHPYIVVDALNNYITISLRMKRTSYSVENSRSIITWELVEKGVGSLSSFSQIATPTPDYTVVINGKTWSGVSDINLEANSEKVLQSGTIEISHTSGAGRSIAYSFSQDMQLRGTASGSGTFYIDALPDYPTLSGPSSFSDEDSPTITYSINAASKNYISKLEACIADGTTGTSIYIDYREIDIDAGTYTFNFTSSERTALRRIAGDANSISVRFYIKTTFTNGEAKAPTRKNSTMYLTAAAPVLSPEVEDTDSTTLALTGDPGTIIRGYNAVYFNSNAVARKGSTIASQSVVCGSRTSNSGAGSFTNVETGTFLFTATDSRGNPASATVNLNVIDYVKVSCRQNIVLNENGTVEVSITGNYFNGSFGAEDNDLTIEIKHTQNDGSAGSWVDITPLLYTTSGNTYELTYTASGFDLSGSYEFQSRVSDKLTTATSEKQTITFSPIFDWSQHDFNFNVPVVIEGGKAYGVHELYSGFTGNNLVLNDDIDNYDFIDIYFTDNNGRGSGVARLFGVGGASKTIDLALIEASSEANTYIRRTAYICKDRTLSPNKTTAGYLIINATGIQMINDDNYIRVIRVLGYR